MAENKTDSQKKGFNVALGLVDYVNPLTYSINTFLILSGARYLMDPLQFWGYLIGIIISLIIGIVIPTGKLLVGMGKIEFRLPYALFFIVNLGIMLTGVSLFAAVAGTKALIIALIIILVIIFVLWAMTKKFNSAIMFTGTLGYTLIYISLIMLALRAGKILPMIMFILCWCIMMGIIVMSMKVDLTNPKWHWPIEGGNIGTQIILMIGLIILFKL